jgi:hypothetical protein
MVVSFRNLPFLPAVANRYIGTLSFAGCGRPRSQRGLTAKTSFPAESGIGSTAPTAPLSRKRCVFVFPMF